MFFVTAAIAESEAFNVSVVVALDAMRLEHEMIPHPNRVEAIGFGALRAFQAICR